MNRLLAVLLFVPSLAFAEAFEWDYDMSLLQDGFVDGFTVVCNGDEVWTGVENRTPNIDLGNGRNTCYVFAFNSNQVSGNSDEVRFLSGPLPSPETFRITSP